MRKLALPIALVFGFAMVGCSDDDSCVDVDGDGYGEGSGCLGPDCDDNDDAVWMDMDGYGDVDGDGESSDTATTGLCTDGTLPAGYSATAGTDCDDTDADAIMIVDGYLDGDGDGYGTGEVMDVCGDTDYLPPGYADNNTDCDDASDMLFEAMDLYPDADGDMVYSPDIMTVCTDGTMPAGYSDMAGTDCDDADPYASDDSSALQDDMCTLKGTCADTEIGAGYPDMMGVGACLGVDCNGANPAAAIPLEIDMTATCNDEADCGGDPCFDADDPLNAASASKHCWNTFTGCNYGTGTCSEISGCLTACKAASTDPTVYVPCMQMGCIENSSPKAQWLYDIAQTCAAEEGCFAYSDPAQVQACALGAACNAVFLQCLGDMP